MPIVAALGNKFLKEYHWREIRQVLSMEDSDFQIEEKKFTLGELIAFDVGDKQEEVVHISTTATQEDKLETELRKIVQTWDEKEFNVIKHDKNANSNNIVYKLKDWDAIIMTLDDSLASISDIQGSRYVKRLIDRVEETHNMLILVSDTIEQWKIFQRQWLYLKNIFGADGKSEINQKCSKEANDFSAVDKKYQSQMKKVFQRKIVKIHCTQSRLDEFLSNNRKLEEIQKKVEEYLDQKRAEFPRLYFISNDELLHLLSRDKIDEVEQ